MPVIHAFPFCLVFYSLLQAVIEALQTKIISHNGTSIAYSYQLFMTSLINLLKSLQIYNIFIVKTSQYFEPKSRYSKKLVLKT